jgi:hypothetical protein
MTLALRHNFGVGSVQASLSKADARDPDSGVPTPEAPRTIFDFLGTIPKLPLHLEAKGEFEFVGRKPLEKDAIRRTQSPNVLDLLQRNFQVLWSAHS